MSEMQAGLAAMIRSCACRCLGPSTSRSPPASIPVATATVAWAMQPSSETADAEPTRNCPAILGVRH